MLNECQNYRGHGALQYARLPISSPPLAPLACVRQHTFCLRPGPRQQDRTPTTPSRLRGPKMGQRRQMRVHKTALNNGAQQRMPAARLRGCELARLTPGICYFCGTAPATTSRLTRIGRARRTKEVTPQHITPGEAIPEGRGPHEDLFFFPRGRGDREFSPTYSVSYRQLVCCTSPSTDVFAPVQYP
jgi:hypothetical protein